MKMKRSRMSVLVAVAVLATSGATLAVAQDDDAGGHGATRAPRASVGRYWGTDVSVGPGRYGTASASCPAGMVSTGGGGAIGGGAQSGDPYFIGSYGGSDGWVVGVKNTDSVTRSVTAFVVCMTP
ncbi:hypothetical protein VSR01_32130 [Actinacidiphila sp. DG2A-62]|uniref:hypothetical protein n=1 Tax=Actinacidiphila sp. DG2A-62 TaxID=3108821 RepID=UPI002DBBE14B|nr:hypothetical protein [Actinacidiphila sp. DG2A-62]MEC3997889.1 hypothetical protein [Actinacidiphila sp. DG2A-62]